MRGVTLAAVLVGVLAIAVEVAGGRALLQGLGDLL
jgi:hypothetical protein